MFPVRQNVESQKLNKFYIGYSSEIIQRRIEKHNASFYGGKKYNHQTNDWELFHYIECKSIGQAIRIKKHIKRMKSRRYINNLIKYPKISEKLLLKYKSVASYN